MENSISPRTAPQAWKSYSLAILSALTALLIRFIFAPALLLRSPLLGFFLAAALSAGVGGSGPGFVCTMLGAIFGFFFVLPEPGSHFPHKPVDYIGIVFYLLGGCFVSVLAGRLKKANTTRNAVHFLYQQILNSIEDGVIAVDEHQQICLMNPVAERLTGWTDAEAQGMPLDQVFRVVSAGTNRAAPPAAERDWTAANFEYPELLNRTGDRTPIEQVVAPIFDPERGGFGSVVVVRDVRARRDAEHERRDAREALLRAQKLESIGILAGGVAHDFNNLLTGILGGTALALDSIPPSNPAHGLLRNVLAASERASDLTRQMLAYAGKGEALVEAVDLSEAVSGTLEAIQASIPKSVRVAMKLAEDLPPVLADRTQMQQVIMNLIINGAEAVGEQENGQVEVRTRVEVHSGPARLCQFSGNLIPPGPYAVLEVQDTGAGIDEAVIPRIFDPFFTTKFTGRGLGLAAVLGIVRINHGCIEIETGSSAGATFRVFIPTMGPRAKATSSGL